MGLSYRPLKNRDKLYDVATQMIVTHIQDEVKKRSIAKLLLSGGSTPGPVYQNLSTIALPWPKVKVGLVDERWVDESDPGSNAALIRRTLLQNNAKPATFLPMKTEDATALAGQPKLGSVYADLVTINSFVVLGMGTDGHVCSWFQGAEGFEVATDPGNRNLVQAIKAKKTDVTGDYLERMTLTYSALSKCKSLLLLITGDEKRRVIEKAFESRNSDLPVSRLIRMAAKSGDPARFTILQAE